MSSTQPCCKPQLVQIVLHSSTPQDCVLSPVLCWKHHSLISNNDKTTYREEVDPLALTYNLSQNIGKTKEVIIVFKEKDFDHISLTINWHCYEEGQQQKPSEAIAHKLCGYSIKASNLEARTHQELSPQYVFPLNSIGCFTIIQHCFDFWLYLLANSHHFL